MDPTTQPTPTSPAPTDAQPVVEYVRTQRSTAAYILLGLSAACLAVTIWAAVKGFKPRPAPVDQPADTKMFDPENPTPPKPEVTDPNRHDYTLAAIGGLMGFLVTAAVGVWLLVGIPNPSVERQRTEARMALLVVGGVLGITLMALGGLYFYRWSEALTGWLDKGETKQARWVLIPLLMVVGGAALVFASTQPARAEERNDPVIRRVVYGANFGLAALLVFLVLIVANVFVSLRVPNKLDTTETGFYSLSSSTEEFLAKLDQPVTAYGILPESGSREVDDIRRLLTSFQDSPGSRVKVRFISPTLNKSELRTLANKYPQVELNETGVLLTAGEDEKRNSFIREDEFMDRGMPGRGAAAGRSFVGESRLVREIAFLAENKQRAVVYFTQSAGELSIAGDQADIAPSDAGTQLKAFLERNNLDVRPLKFDLADAKVPDDATVLVVADPKSPLTEAAAGAIRKYMVEPRPGGGKGKLIVLSGARFGPDGKVVKTGLEPLLAEFKIMMMDRLVLSEDTRELDPDQAAVAFSRAAVTAKNPVAVTLGERVIFLAANWRPVGAMTAAPEVPGAPATRAITLLYTYPGRANWLEEERPTDLNKIVRELNTIPAVRAAKQLTESPRPVAAVASEGDVGRVAVFGNGRWVSDAAARQNRSGSAPVTFDLVSGTIDWLRDRPVVGQGIEAKKYKEYTFPAAVDETRILWFPLGLAFALIAGLGAGVWVIRRK